MVAAQDRKLATIVAVDMVGYSASAEHDQARAADRVKWLERRLSELADKHGGRIFSTAGDGFMLEFALASAAVRAALELLNDAGDRPPVRIGAHLGEVITKGSDLLGHGVNVAARLMSAAQPNHIVITEALHAQLRGEVTAAFESLGPMRLNKMRETVVAYSYPPQPAGAARMRRARDLVKRHWPAVTAVATAGLIAIGALYLLTPPRFELSRLEPVAQSRQPEIFPTLSPDGRFVVYTLITEPGADLFMRPVEGGDELRLTDTAEQHEIAAAFSPRGDQLAFVRATLPDEGAPPPCEIVVQPFPQGLGRRVGGCETAADTFRLSWSPDGASIVFSEPVEGSMFGTARVRRLDIESGRTSDFIPPPRSGPGDFNAVYSPSGRHVAFVRYADQGVAEIRLFDTRTRREYTLMDGLAWGHLDWIDDDRLIAVTRVSGTQRSSDLWIVSRHGAAPQHLLPTLTDLSRVDHANGALAFQVSSSVQNLRQFAAGRQTSVTSANVEDHDADFSPAGALAYISVGAREWIYLQQPGEPPRRFVETAGHSAYGLRWSNDGRHLVYSGVNDGRRRLFVTEVGSGVTQVVASPQGEEPTNPAWGLNDRSLIYAGLTDRGARLMRVDFDSARPAQPISGYGWVEAVETPNGLLARNVDDEGVWLLRENEEPRLLCRELPRVGLTRFSARDWQVGGDRIYVLESASDAGSRVSHCPTAGGPAQLAFEVEADITGSLAVQPTTGAIVFAELVERQADVAIAQLARVGLLGGDSR